MTIFGQNHEYLPEGINGTFETRVLPSTFLALNYVFFVSFTLNFVITVVVNPAAFWVRFKTAKDSVPSFITCVLMVSDLVTNVYFPILWNFKLLRKNTKDDWVYLPPSPFEVFNTCLLDIVSFLSVFYVAALSVLLKKNVENPLKPVSKVNARRFVIGGTVFIAGSVFVLYSVHEVLKNHDYVSLRFNRYAQRVVAYMAGTGDFSIIYNLFFSLRTANILIIIISYLHIAYMLIRKSGMNETRRQSMRGGKVAAAMSLGSLTYYILAIVEEHVTRHDENLQHYGLFLRHCFAPSMLATYNSFIQVALVKEVQGFLKSMAATHTAVNPTLNPTVNPTLNPTILGTEIRDSKKQ